MVYLYNASLNAVTDAEFEIRADFFKNLTYTKSSIWSIYFNRYIVYGLEAIGIFILAFIMMGIPLDYSFKSNIQSLDLFYYLLLSLVFNIAIYFFLISITFIFERAMTFANLIMTALLFLTGMVFEFNNVISNSYINISRFLYGMGSSLTFIFVLVVWFIMKLFIKYTDKYLYS